MFLPLRAWWFCLVLLGLSACSQFAPVVQYSEELNDKDTGRSLMVRGPAKLGGLVGFLAGVPIDIVASPVSYGVYEFRSAQEPIEEPDLLSHLLFPSFVLWRVGALLGAPFDLIEWSVYRAWQPPQTLTEEERRDLELRIDEEALPRYPIEPIYPQPEGS